MKPWLKACLILVGIWIFAAIGIFWVRSAVPSAESVQLFVKQHPLKPGSSESERAKVINAVASKLNRLEYEQRQKLRRSDAMDRFYKDLTPDERSHFLDATLPQGFKQMMLSFNKMEPDRRKKFVDRAMQQLAEHPGDREDRLDPTERQKIISQGLSSFYEEASTEVKLDFAPLIEQIQRSLQEL